MSETQAAISTEYPDVDVHREGTLFLVGATTDKGARWLGENVVTDDTTWWLSSIVVEHRYIEDLVCGMIDAGLVVRYKGHKLALVRKVEV